MSISVAEALKPFRIPALMILVGLIGLFAGDWVYSRFFSDISPVQPIEFSHRIHAQDHEIPCLHCHVYAERTQVAGVPPVSKCIGCHRGIDKDSRELQKLVNYWESREPIPWIKVHDVPDFVHFTHKRHVRAGLQCQECHGPVETMDRVTRVASLRMPWCVECHRAHEVEHGSDCTTCHK